MTLLETCVRASLFLLILILSVILAVDIAAAGEFSAATLQFRVHERAKRQI